MVLLASLQAKADLVVLGKLGETVPSQEYFKNISLKDVKLDYDKANRLLDAAKKSISSNVFFPLLPSKMKPGVLKGHRFDSSKKIHPFAVVGTDNISMKWLSLRQSKLEELNTPVYVVEAESMDLVRRLASKYKSMKFVPANGDGLAENLKVKAYPFLVTSSGVWQ